MNKIIKSIPLIIRNPRSLILIIYDIFNKNFNVFDNKVHIEASIDWLCYAQDMTSDSGVSAGYSMVCDGQLNFSKSLGFTKIRK